MSHPSSAGPARAPSWLPIGVGTELPTDEPVVQEPPRARRSVLSVLPALMIVVSILAGFGVIAVAVSPRSGFDGFFADDGALTTVTDLAGRPRQLEQAVVGPLALTELGATGRAVSAGLSPAQATTTRFLRATVNPSPNGVEQVWFGADADLLRLSLVSTPTVAFALVPGIEVARSAGSPPTTQTGMITVLDPATRRPTTTAYRAGVDADGGGCSSLTLQIDAGSRIDVTATLCASTGLTAFAVTTGTARFGFTPAAAGPLPGYAGPTAAPVRAWTSHARWKPSTLQPYSVDAFGAAPVVRGLQARPTVRADQTLVVASATTSDLEAYRTTADGLELLWRAHPGGSIAAITAVGDLTVAALASGRLVGYDADGRRAWENDQITETVAGELLPLTDAVALATLDGTVWRIDPRTGAVLWSRTTAARINKGVVGDDRVVQAIDTAGGVYGWVPSGQQVFNGQVAQPFDLIALDADNTYLIRGITMEGYGLQHSEFLWGVPAAQTPVDLCTTGSGPVVAMSLATVGLNPATGAIAWSADGAEEVRCGASAVITVEGTRVSVVSADGRSSLQLSAPVPVRDQSVSGIATAPDAAYVVLRQTVIRLGP